MSSFEAEATIARSAQDVWTYAADIPRHPDWMAVANARVVRGHGTEVGARGRERLIVGPFHWDVEFEVAEAEPGRRILWRAANPRFESAVGLVLEQIGPTSTRATYRGTVRLRGRWRLLAPFMAMEGAAAIRGELQRLKENVETAPATAPATL